MTTKVSRSEDPMDVWQTVERAQARKRAPVTRRFGSDKPDPAVLTILRERLKSGQAWFAYQNVAPDSANLGHLQFLCCGPGCTFTEPPARMPDTAQSINWRYILVGRVDLTTGEITEAP